MLDVDPKFQPLIDDLTTQGFSQWIFKTEFWWLEDGLKLLAKRTSICFSHWVNDKEAGVTKDEKKYAEIVWKHFPQVKQMAKEIASAKASALG